MKKVILSLLMVIILFPLAVYASDNTKYNAEQLNLRNELFKFLKEEGFTPEIDSDGDIKFKSDGSVYYFSVSKTDDNPMYVVLFRIFDYPDNISVERMLLATKQLGLYKGVKVVCFDNSFRIGAEIYVRSSEQVKGTFYKLKSIIDLVKSDIIDECERVGSVPSYSLSGSKMPTELPFIVTKMEVANVENDGTIITDYGKMIFDFNTQYLKPRIFIKPSSSRYKTYKINVRLYKDNVLQSNGSSSAQDFTFSQDISVDGRNGQVIELFGWGSKNAGNWSSGHYRFEVWYGDYCLGSKAFKVL